MADEKVQAEQLKKHGAVKEALDQAKPPPGAHRLPTHKSHRVWIGTPITSFIGWIYILVRKPYRVGDRIRIGEASGDVIDVSYLDTTCGSSAASISPRTIRADASSSFRTRTC